jgi:heme-degrading monooxygenase HmoA
MRPIYACGQWKVRAGEEEEFVRRWKDLADWTPSAFPDAVIGTARLIQSRTDPTRFVSLGPFESADAFAEWRAHPVFKEKQDRIAEVLESGDRDVYEVRAEVVARQAVRHYA